MPPSVLGIRAFGFTVLMVPLLLWALNEISEGKVRKFLLWLIGKESKND